MHHVITCIFIACTQHSRSAETGAEGEESEEEEEIKEEIKKIEESNPQVSHTEQHATEEAPVEVEGEMPTTATAPTEEVEKAPEAEQVCDLLLGIDFFEGVCVQVACRHASLHELCSGLFGLTRSMRVCVSARVCTWMCV